MFFKILFYYNYSFQGCKVTKKRAQNKINLFIFFAECIVTYLKLHKKVETPKQIWNFHLIYIGMLRSLLHLSTSRIEQFAVALDDELAVSNLLSSHRTVG